MYVTNGWKNNIIWHLHLLTVQFLFFPFSVTIAVLEETSYMHPSNPLALWTVTIFCASVLFIPSETLHLEQIHGKALWAGYQLTVMRGACLHTQCQSLHKQWPGIALTPDFKTLLLIDPQGHLINMDPFRSIWVQHIFLKLYKKTRPTYESTNL